MEQKFNVVIEQGEDGYLISEVLELPDAILKQNH